MLGTELKQEIFKTAGVATIALLYAFLGKSFPVGGTVVVALSVVQVISLANLLFTLPPRKVVGKADADEAANVWEDVLRTVFFFANTIQAQRLALFVLPLVVVKALLLSGFINSGAQVAALACCVGSVCGLLRKRNCADAEQDNGQSPYESKFWEAQASVGSLSTPLANTVEEMDEKVELERELDSHSREAWETYYINEDRMAHLDGDQEQWDQLVSIDEA